MQRKVIERFIDGITDIDIHRYGEYLESIRPADFEGLFRRFIFAYCSIQTSWQMNVKLYEMLKSNEWRTDEAELMALLVSSRAGFHNNRTRYLADFAKKFWDDPYFFLKKWYESWTVYRDRIVKRMLGMGLAKVSFTLEMAYPSDAQVVCLDRHMLRVYKRKQDKHNSCGAALYREFERHWCKCCKARGVPPTIARWIYWDRIQGQKDSRYWAHVLEEVNA